MDVVVLLHFIITTKVDRSELPLAFHLRKTREFNNVGNKYAMFTHLSPVTIPLLPPPSQQGRLPNFHLIADRSRL